MENAIRGQGYQAVAGVDEAGIGALVGSVVAAAVILDPSKPIIGLNDSKLLSPEVREDLYDEIISECLSYGIGFGSVERIEQINIYWASREAMIAAVEQLDPKPNFLLIDGNKPLKINILQKSIVKGDGKCSCIAAASILAKVTRDRLMCRLAEQYPEYGFQQHKGYGTSLHLEMIRKYGVTPIHRVTFKGVAEEIGHKYIGKGE
jgi:ribonuclease HII